MCFFAFLKRLQKLETFAGTFAEIYQKKIIVMLGFSSIFAIENETDCIEDLNGLFS